MASQPWLLPPAPNLVCLLSCPANTPLRTQRHSLSSSRDTHMRAGAHALPPGTRSDRRCAANTLPPQHSSGHSTHRGIARGTHPYAYMFTRQTHPHGPRCTTLGACGLWTRGTGLPVRKEGSWTRWLRGPQGAPGPPAAQRVKASSLARSEWQELHGVAAFTPCPSFRHEAVHGGASLHQAPPDPD